MIDLRGLASDGAFMAAVKDVLGTRPADRSAQQRRLGRCQGVVALDRSMARSLPAGKNSGASPPPAQGAGTDPFVRRRCLRHARDHPDRRRRCALRAAQGLFARSSVRGL